MDSRNHDDNAKIISDITDYFRNARIGDIRSMPGAGVDLEDFRNQMLTVIGYAKYAKPMMLAHISLEKSVMSYIAALDEDVQVFTGEKSLDELRNGYTPANYRYFEKSTMMSVNEGFPAKIEAVNYHLPMQYAAELIEKTLALLSDAHTRASGAIYERLVALADRGDMHFPESLSHVSRIYHSRFPESIESFFTFVKSLKQRSQGAAEIYFQRQTADIQRNFKSVELWPRTAPVGAFESLRQIVLDNVMPLIDTLNRSLGTDFEYGRKVLVIVDELPVHLSHGASRFGQLYTLNPQRLLQENIEHNGTYVQVEG